MSPYILVPTTQESGAPLSDLLLELYARGYDHLAQDSAGRARAMRWINQASAELCLEELWPFRLTTTSGAAPLTISDMDRVLTVINVDDGNRELVEMTELELTVDDLDQTGDPVFFYRDSLLVRVWPSATDTIEVRYYALPDELANDTDESMVPKRYMNVIVDGAVMRAAADRDNPQAVDLASRMYDRGLALMRRQLLVAPTHIQRSALHLDA